MTGDFRAKTLRAVAFLGARAFGAFAFFFVELLVTDFPFKGSRAFAFFLDVPFCTTALLAFGRVGFLPVTRLLAVDFGEDRWAVARDVERLRPFETALMEASSERGLK